MGDCDLDCNCDCFEGDDCDCDWSNCCDCNCGDDCCDCDCCDNSCTGSGHCCRDAVSEVMYWMCCWFLCDNGDGIIICPDCSCCYQSSSPSRRVNRTLVRRGRHRKSVARTDAEEYYRTHCTEPQPIDTQPQASLAAYIPNMESHPPLNHGREKLNEPAHTQQPTSLPLTANGNDDQVTQNGGDQVSQNGGGVAEEMPLEQPPPSYAEAVEGLGSRI